MHEDRWKACRAADEADVKEIDNILFIKVKIQLWSCKLGHTDYNLYTSRRSRQCNHSANEMDVVKVMDDYSSSPST